MKKRILSVLLSIVLALTILPGTAFASSAGIVPHDGKDVELWSGLWMFLHGNAVIITDGDTAGTTKVYLDEDGDGQIEAGQQPLTFSGVDGSQEAGYDLSGVDVYCLGAPGGYTAHTGDVLVTMTGGHIQLLSGSMAPFTSHTGDFTFNMTGGKITGSVMPGGDAATLTGNVTLNISGSAETGQSVYGGSQNGGCTIDGNININISGSAKIATGGYSGEGVFLSGQQDNDTVKGTATINMTGGTVNGEVSANLYNTIFKKAVTINISGGTVTGYVRGVRGATVETVTLNLSGGSLSYVIGVFPGNVTDSVTINMTGAAASGTVWGVYGGTAEKAVVNVTGGSITGSVFAKSSDSSAGLSNGVIDISGGEIGGTVALNQGGSIITTSSTLNLSGAPVFGTYGKILLRKGEFITADAAYTGVGAVPVDVAALTPGGAGTLVVKALSGVTTDVEDYSALNIGNTYRLMKVLTNENIYLGDPTIPIGAYDAETDVKTGAPLTQTNVKEQKDYLLSDDDNMALIQGQDIDFKLIVEDATSTVNADIKTAIDGKAATEGLTLGQYLDIYIERYIDNVLSGRVTDLTQPIRITITIPDGIYRENRNYCIIKAKVNDLGQVEPVILPDLDNVPETLTIESDSFSIFTLAYIDAVAKPLIDPAGGSYVSGPTVSLSCATEDAVIYYTTNGNEPTENSTKYDGPFDVLHAQTIKAKAFKPGMAPSETASATFTFPPKYSLSYDGNKPHGMPIAVGNLPENEICAFGIPFTLGGPPILPGYIFVGWYMEKECVNFVGMAGASVSNLTSEENGSVTLYARWMKISKAQSQKPASSPEQPVTPPAPASPFILRDLYRGFIDVDESKWYGVENTGVIRDAVNLGIMQGIGNNKFAPDDKLSLAEAIKMACVVHSIYEGDNYSFRMGIPWYDVYIEYAIEHGIIKADDFDDYTRTCLRAEAAYIFANALPDSELTKISSLTPPDVTAGDKYAAEILKLYAAGVLMGSDQYGTFGGQEAFTRAQAAAIIVRLALAERRL